MHYLLRQSESGSVKEEVRVWESLESDGLIPSLVIIRNQQVHARDFVTQHFRGGLIAKIIFQKCMFVNTTFESVHIMDCHFSSDCVFGRTNFNSCSIARVTGIANSRFEKCVLDCLTVSSSFKCNFIELRESDEDVFDRLRRT